MTTTNKENKLVAPCGASCGHCPNYLAKSDPAMMEFLVSTGSDKDKLHCEGCRPLGGRITCVNEKFNFPKVDGRCATYACAMGSNSSPVLGWQQ